MNNVFTMSVLSENLKRRAAELGLADAEVARRAGLSTRRYGNYAEGTREPDFDTFLKICDVLETTPNGLLGVQTQVDRVLARAAAVAKPKQRRHIGNTPDQLPAFNGSLTDGLVECGGVEYVSIARYDAALSAGAGSLIDPNAEPLGYTLIETQWLTAVTSVAPQHLAIVRVDGDSMVPTLLHDDWVLVDRTKQRASQPGIYALRVDESTWIKRLMLDLASRDIRIISDNPVWPEQRQPADEISVIGRFVALVWRKSAV